ncbi:MAG: glycosyltransferase family 2 protein [Planctomycetota bacterium]
MTALSTPLRPAAPAARAIDLSVAIVNYRSLPLLSRCLETFARASKGLATELFVLENGTGEDIEPVVLGLVPGARVIVREESTWFSRAVNEALARAQGRHVAILNPDTLLGEGSLAALVRHLDEHEDVGIVGPRVWDDEARTSLQRSFRRFPDLRTAFCHRYSLLARLWPSNPWTRAYLRSDLAPDEAIDTDWVSGCCLVVRGDLFRRLGGLDSDYPMFCEDVDLCRRAGALGYRVVYEPSAEIVHLIGGSRRRAPLRGEWLRHRSIAHYVAKFHGRANPLSWLLLVGVWARFALRLAVPGRTR